MPVTEISTDAENLTMTVVADFPVPVERLWAAYTTPETLERFWGPPEWPARFSSFDLRVGGVANYRMNGPHGEIAGGRWEFLSIDAPRSFSILDSFADENGQVNPELPTSRMEYRFEPTATGSRVSCVATFESLEALQTVVEMGVIEGTKLATNQLDRVLMQLRDLGPIRTTELEMLGDERVRITRIVKGDRELVWRAHVEPELIRKWMLGPDGWKMTVCDFEPKVGIRYRYAWEPEDASQGTGFGFEGEILLVEPNRRLVNTEQMVGMGEVPSTLNDLDFFEEDGYTQLTLIVEYPSKEVREAVLATGMVDGMESSYQRLEREVLGVS